LLDELFRVTQYDVLVVGGLEQEVPGFVEVLPPRLRSLVAGTFVVDQSTDNREEIKKRAGEVLSEYERVSEREAVGRALETAAAGGRAVVGPEDCLWACSVAAVDRLLVRADAVLPGVVCDASAWLGTSGDTCPVCGEAVRKTPDVLDELVQSVIEEGGAVHHVSQDTRLRESLVAAELRFPLPPMPTR
jgi:peptide chain release factor subunit 1